MISSKEQAASSWKRIFKRGRTPVADSPVQATAEQEELRRREENERTRRDILRLKKDEMIEFLSEPHTPGAQMILFSDQEAKGIDPEVSAGIVQDLYRVLGAKVPPDLDGSDPEVQHEFGLHQHYNYDYRGLSYYIEENVTPFETLTPVSPNLAISREITFTWQNHNKSIISKSTTHALVRTEPKAAAKT